MQTKELEPFNSSLPMMCSLAYVLPGTKKVKEKTMTTSKIVEIAASSLQISTEKIIMTTRKSQIVTTRQIICYLARHYTVQSLKEIGISLKIDHSTVIHSAKVVENAIRMQDDRYMQVLNSIEPKLRK